METLHLPVMAAEVVELLVTRTDGSYVDCTVGGGGHAYHILNNAPSGVLLGIDIDATALERAAERLRPFGERARLARANFADLDSIAPQHGIARADGVLFDLGFSSLQLDDPGRGLSFQTAGPIDMRLRGSGGPTARELIARTGEQDLARIILEFGEERRAHPIARSIIDARDRGRLETTLDLAAAVLATKPAKRTKTLARVFQALRIAVNHEIENLGSGLAKAVDLLAPGGRVAVISYHSLEDRLAKRHFTQCEKPCTCPPDLPQCVCGRRPTLRVITRRAVRPSVVELAGNPRARSAKLRAAQRLAPGEEP